MCLFCNVDSVKGREKKTVLGGEVNQGGKLQKGKNESCKESFIMNVCVCVCVQACLVQRLFLCVGVFSTTTAGQLLLLPFFYFSLRQRLILLTVLTRLCLPPSPPPHPIPFVFIKQQNL